MCRQLMLNFAMLCAEAVLAQEPLRQVEFIEPVNLLSSDGALEAWGWAKRAQMVYNREAIPVERRQRVKEWEHYTVMSPKFTVGVTIAQLGSLTFGSVELIDYERGDRRDAMFFGPPSREGSVFPPNPHGDTELRGKDDSFVSLRVVGDRRRIAFDLRPTPVMTSAFQGELELTSNPAEDSVALARPFDEPGHFFYENKMFGMPARGRVQVNDDAYTLPESEAFAIFDWGRGIWPRNSQWFWGQAAGRVGQRRVAINLGHGYGDDRRGTANAILVDGKLSKLGDVPCQFDPEDRMKSWKFASDDGRLALDFEPLYDQHSKQDALIAAAELHKVHGHYSGTLVVEGETLRLQKMLGFAEHMVQRW